MKKWEQLIGTGLLAACLGVAAGCASNGGARSPANVYVSPDAQRVQRVAVLPFRAATELIGASVSDLFVTELMKTGRYELIERGQLANVLGETDVQLSGLTQGQVIQLGRMAGADAVVVGTVTEYEMAARSGRTAPVVGVSVRLVDATTSKVLWSVDHAARGASGETLTQQARSVVREMVQTLNRQLR